MNISSSLSNSFRVWPQTQKQNSAFLTQQKPPQQYICERVFKEKPLLCRIAIPYCIDNQDVLNSPIEKVQPKKVLKRIQMRNKTKQKKSTHKPFMYFQKTPINEFLNYELSEQINMGLKQVKTIADEIKDIKKQKLLAEAENEKNICNKKKIRIRRTNFKSHKGLLLHNKSKCLIR